VKKPSKWKTADMKRMFRLWRDMPNEERDKMADALETSPAYLSQIAYGHRNPGNSLRRLLLEYIEGLKP